MNEILLALLIGCVAGIIDIAPMIKQRLGIFAISSAFTQWLVLGLLIPNANLFGLSGWANGMTIAVLTALPIIILVAENDKKAVPIILSMSAILGSAVGAAGNYFGL
ncbi:hypothetical protein D0S45_15925 [Marinifilum sp. JC120]|nr:hypothetical protein D0S45_15925 [Marinifilum sp. JC120]